jgi:hypothetical protein
MSHTVRHTFKSPAWQCEVCEVPWPCQNRRTRLLAKYTRDGQLPYLREMLRTFMARARRDLDLTEEEFAARFVGWTFASAESDRRRPGLERDVQVSRKRSLAR